MVESELPQLLKESRAKYIPKIEYHAGRFFAVMQSPAFENRLKETSRNLGVNVDNLWNASYDAVILGESSRIRPWISSLVHDAIRGKNAAYKHAFPLSTIVELVHKGSLVIDDIQDDTPIRKGSPTIHKVYGKDIAELTGNFLMKYAPDYYLGKNSGDLFLGEGRPGLRERVGRERVDRIREMLNSELGIGYFGQATDVKEGKGKFLAEGRIPTEEEYVHMASGKSTIPLAMRLGVILGGGSVKQETQSSYIGELIGIALQIADDVEEFKPSPDPTKESDWLGDIREGKKTLPVVYALEHGGPKAERLRQIFLDEGGIMMRALAPEFRRDARIAEAVRILYETGAVERAQKKAEAYIAEARDKMRELLPDSSNPAVKTLEALLDQAIKREG